MRPQPTCRDSTAPQLSHEIAWILLFKLMAIWVLWYLFFSSPHVVVVTPEKVSTAVFDVPAAPPAAKTRS